MTSIDSHQIRRVVHVIYSGLGGHAAMMFSLLENGFLSDASHHVVLAGVEPPMPDYTARLDAMQISWSHVSKPPGRGHLRFYKDLRRIFLHQRPDLIFLNGLAATPAAALLCRMKGRPKLMLRESEPVQLKSRYEWGMLALAHLTLDNIVHLTPEAASGAQKALGRLHRLNKVRIIPNGLDTDFFSPDEVPDGPLNSKRTIQLGMISRLQHKKDHETLLKAVTQLIRTRPNQNFHLHIAGDGATRPQIETMIARLEIGQNVTMHGFLDREGVRALLAQLDIYVHATFGETMSNSIMQAMAMARPVVASNVNGVSNMICEGHGMTYTSGDANSLAQHIARWVDDPSEAALYGTRARARAVERFGIANTTQRYEAIAYGKPE